MSIKMANGNESTTTARNNNSNNKIEQVSLNNSVSLRKVSDTVQFILKRRSITSILSNNVE